MSICRFCFYISWNVCADKNTFKNLSDINTTLSCNFYKLHRARVKRIFPINCTVVVYSRYYPKINCITHYRFPLDQINDTSVFDRRRIDQREIMKAKKNKNIIPRLQRSTPMLYKYWNSVHALRNHSNVIVTVTQGIVMYFIHCAIFYILFWFQMHLSLVTLPRNISFTSAFENAAKTYT